MAPADKNTYVEIPALLLNQLCESAYAFKLKPRFFPLLNGYNNCSYVFRVV